jgi:hypothetical protein
MPAGAQIQFCGEGFNNLTRKVRWEGKIYFIFLDDLEAQRKPAARSASS